MSFIEKTRDPSSLNTFSRYFFCGVFGSAITKFPSLLLKISADGVKMFSGSTPSSEVGEGTPVSLSLVIRMLLMELFCLLESNSSSPSASLSAGFVELGFSFGSCKISFLGFADAVKKYLPPGCT